MNRATDRVIQTPRHNLIYGHRKVSFRPKRPLHRPLKERQIHIRIDETMGNMDKQLLAEFNADGRPYTVRVLCRKRVCVSRQTTCLWPLSWSKLFACVCVCVLSIQQHVLQFILSITQLTIQKRQERDARSSWSIEQEGKPKPLHYPQKAVWPAMDGAERKLLGNGKCDLDRNECDGQEDCAWLKFFKKKERCSCVLVGCWNVSSDCMYTELVDNLTVTENITEGMAENWSWSWPWLSSSSSSSSSYICHGVGPLVDPFRSHVSRSLFKVLPWFLLPFGKQCFITLGSLFRGTLFTCCVQLVLYSSNLSKFGVIFNSFAICAFVL